MSILIQADHRENRSGIPGLLAKNAEIMVNVSSLSAGDYIINGVIGIERKSAEDFVQSIISNLLLEQLSRLKKSVANPLLVIEGNPYKTAHAIDALAIRGAILSALLAWQIPIMLFGSREDTARLLLAAAKQEIVGHLMIRGTGKLPA